jgi:hypothetical protein
MPGELIDELRAAYPVSRVEPPDAGRVWQRGRRARRRRHVTQTAGAVVAVAGLVAGMALVARPARVAVDDEPVAPAHRVDGWAVLAPGTFRYDEIEARLDGWEAVLELEAVDTGVFEVTREGVARRPVPARGDGAVFDVARDGTVAAFLPETGQVVVQPTTGARREFDASFLLEPFPADRSVHRLRLGPDGRSYLSSWAPDAVRDAARLTVFGPDGELVGTKVVPPSLQPPVFSAGRVLLRTDDGWVAVATVGGPLEVRGPVAAPAVPAVSWIGDQGSIWHQLTGGDILGTRYTLEEGPLRLDWTGPDDGVRGWASGPLREEGPPTVVVQHDAGPPLVLLPTPDGLLGAWADLRATGLSGVGDTSAIAIRRDAEVALYWLQDTDDGLAVVRATP